MDVGWLERYSRQIVLEDIGLEGQERLSRATVAVIGLGGLGSPAAMLLASMGVGRLVLVDRDVVSATDLHREPLYRLSDVDVPKVEAAEERLKELNPDLETLSYPEPIHQGNAEEIVGQADVVVDGLDSMAARHIVNRAAVKLGKPYVFAGGIEMYGNITTIIPRETPCLECFYPVYSDEDVPRCATLGVHPSITTLVAALEVEQAVEIITGKRPSLAGRLLYIDLRQMSFEKIDIERVETCPVCGDRPRGKPVEVDIPEAEVSCSRDGSAIYIVNKVVDRLSLDQLGETAENLGYRVLGRTRYSLKISVGEGMEAIILVSGVLIGKARIHRDENLDYFLGLRDRIVETAIHTR